MESLGYVMMYFMRGSLPWQGLRANNRKQKYEKISEKKMSTSVASLCRGFPGMSSSAVGCGAWGSLVLSAAVSRVRSSFVYECGGWGDSCKTLVLSKKGGVLSVVGGLGESCSIVVVLGAVGGWGESCIVNVSCLWRFIERRRCCGWGTRPRCVFVMIAEKTGRALTAHG